MIIHGDSLHELKELDSDSIDFVCTDPPYGYSFMNKSWDKAVPSVEIWRECLRVLKPGAFCCVMSAPRSDVQMHMIQRLTEAGFRLDFTPIYWTYASGFPKATNIGKNIDKRLGVERTVISSHKTKDIRRNVSADIKAGKTDRQGKFAPGSPTQYLDYQVTTATSDQAKALDGSYAGFQPKPAVEVIIVAMKPLSEKTYVDQALANGKGISWLDEGRIPTDSDTSRPQGSMPQPMDWQNKGVTVTGGGSGRFPANLLVSDDVLNDGVERRANGNKSSIKNKPVTSGFLQDVVTKTTPYSDNGSYSRYFDLDKWMEQHPTFPFAIFAKASKSEKNKGLDSFTDKPEGSTDGNSGRSGQRTAGDGITPIQPVFAKNHHPTVKPLKLMSYLITLFSRPGDVVLDPFCGSGSTNVAAHNLGRETIGIERESEYVEIARARLAHVKPEIQQLPPELPEPGQPPVTIADITTPSQLSLL